MNWLLISILISTVLCLAAYFYYVIFPFSEKIEKLLIEFILLLKKPKTKEQDYAVVFEDLHKLNIKLDMTNHFKKFMTLVTLGSEKKSLLNLICSRSTLWKSYYDMVLCNEIENKIYYKEDVEVIEKTYESLKNDLNSIAETEKKLYPTSMINKCQSSLESKKNTIEEQNKKLIENQFNDHLDKYLHFVILDKALIKKILLPQLLECDFLKYTTSLKQENLIRIKNQSIMLVNFENLLLSIKEQIKTFQNKHENEARYVSSRTFNKLKTDVEQNAYKNFENLTFTFTGLSSYAYTQLQDILHNSFAKIDNYNKNYYTNQKLRLNEFFSTEASTLPMSDEQIEAVLSDESINLINAAAGSGKTSVISAKVNHLIKNNMVQPSDILVLTFSRNAKEEMQERIENLVGDGVVVSTIHAQALKTIKSSTKSRPNIAFQDKRSKVTPEEKLKQFIKKILNNIFLQDTFYLKILEFFRYYKHTEKSLLEYQLFDEYKKDRVKINDTFVTPFIPNSKSSQHKVQSRCLETLAPGVYVRSQEEKVIADTLYMYGIKFEYEKEYPHEPSYRPDFYIPFKDNKINIEALRDTESEGLYLEHFSVDEEGNVPPFFKSSNKGKSATEVYQEGMAWKRNIHNKFKTELIETYSYFAKQERLESELLSLLKKYGFQTQKQDRVKFSDSMAEEISSIMIQSINKFKLSGKTILDLKEDIHLEEDPLVLKRNSTLYDVFDICYLEYENYLNENFLYDFSGLLIKATQLIKTNSLKNKNFSYVIVDEFQDTSKLAMSFICSLWEQYEDTRLFLVGDDWQSIYGFNGSDVSLMTSFNEEKALVRKATLQTNYRSTKNIVELGQIFIKKNKAQTQKNTSAFNNDLNPSVLFKDSDFTIEFFNKLYQESIDKYNLSNPSILFLGRTQKDLKEWRDHYKKSVNSEIFKNITFLTVHASKGLEADFVFLLPPTIGFPISIPDDPFLFYFQITKDSFPNAEERRVFYVALTRAKKFLVLLDDPKKKHKSIFWHEAEEIAFDNKLSGQSSNTYKYINNDRKNELIEFITDNEAFTIYSHFCSIEKSSLQYEWLKGTVIIKGNTQKLIISKNYNLFSFLDENSSPTTYHQIYELIKSIYSCTYEDSLKILYNKLIVQNS